MTDLTHTGGFQDSDYQTAGIDPIRSKLLLDYCIPATSEALEPLAEAVMQVLIADSELSFQINLCLEELVINVIDHGLKDQADHVIYIQIRQVERALLILVKDDAPCFDPFTSAPQPNLALDVEDRPVGGLGVFLIKQFMDDCQAYYDGTGNLIVLRKAFGQQR